MNIEITKKIEGYENYTISSFGNVFDLVKKRFLRPSIHTNIDGKQYYHVNLRSENRQKIFYMHRLIATAFIPNPNNEKCIDHVNGNGLVNSIENLRWVSHQQNMHNRIKKKNTNFQFKGIRKSKNKFKSDIKLNNINYYIGTYHTIQECAYAYNIASKALHKEYGCLNVVAKPINYKQIKYRVYNALSKHFPEFEAKAIIYERYKNFIILYD